MSDFVPGCGRSCPCRERNPHEPYVEPAKKRLTIQVLSWNEWNGGSRYALRDDPNLPWYWRVLLDGRALGGAEVIKASTEPEARAAAQAYVDELLAHFRNGGE
jgi:hypothetical protein